MKNNPSFSVEPFVQELNQTLTPSSWVAINASSDNVKVVFFDNSLAPSDYKFESFKDFAKFYIEEEFKFFEKNDKNVNHSEEKSCAMGSTATTHSEHEDTSRKSHNIFLPDAQIIDVYKSLDMSTIEKVISDIKKSVKELEGEAVFNAKESHLYNTDPYSYYGVSKKDFF